MPVHTDGYKQDRMQNLSVGPGRNPVLVSFFVQYWIYYYDKGQTKTRCVFLNCCGVVTIKFLWQLGFRSGDLLKCAGLGLFMLLCDKEARYAANNCT